MGAGQAEQVADHLAGAELAAGDGDGAVDQPLEEIHAGSLPEEGRGV